MMRVHARLAALILAIAVLAGCNGNGYPPVIEDLEAVRSPSGTLAYVVKAGDTLWSIARRFGSTATRLADINQLSLTDDLEVGQALLVPLPAGGVSSSAKGKGWVRPVRGKTVVRFGQLKDGLKSWGIDIRAGSGAGIVAARGGLVRKSGPFVGLGNTVVIEHEGGKIVTLYGQIGSLLVKEGDVVRKGQKIGLAPDTRGTPPEVHFRMFRKGYPVDPEKYLP
jgi:murein DD-endopeptidase MepM/ murein hydrolase activator NlpD